MFGIKHNPPLHLNPRWLCRRLSQRAALSVGRLKGVPVSQLSGEQIEAIAEKAAGKAIEKLTGRICQEVGKSVASKLTYITGGHHQPVPVVAA